MKDRSSVGSIAQQDTSSLKCLMHCGMKATTFTALVAAIITAPIFNLGGQLLAQDGDGRTALSSEGIAGDIDKHHRSPMLTVQTSVNNEQFGLTVDTSVLNKEFIKYPIKVEYFVNRELVSTQYRSPELPGALGITLNRSQYSLPVNYSVVATLLHPNRTYTTVIQGAVFESDLTGISSCSLTVTKIVDEAEVATTYESSAITLSQATSSSFNLSFDGTAENGSVISASASLTLSGDQLSGTLATTEEDGTVTAEFSGTATKDGDKLTALSGSTSDLLTNLECEG